MPSIKEQKLIYHLTSLNNVSSILEGGLLPRSALETFHDVANVEILQGREIHHLQDYVPFHWFAKNPFDGRVQRDRPDEEFVLISVRRSIAKARNWKVIPRHPLSGHSPEVYDYDEGFALIDWDTMQCRDYSDANCKSVCMAECISPEVVSVRDFFKFFVPTENIRATIAAAVSDQDLVIDVVTNRGMFC
ncbi:DarT ssDNA thymidine ADP-ribosyltransferase family protein [Saccharospirillum sp. HFRX-1]|uniref:DarT ssDNA thymidine ADP-ribosyltransferase family protein n=1 Tax=unclassified Saccharospirillum TaxID=2633430 RepID=UPI0037243FB7